MSEKVDVSVVTSQPMKNRWYDKLLSCPDCWADLRLIQEKVRCVSCDYSKPINKCLDLRPISARNVNLSLPRIPRNDPNSLLEYADIERPCITYDGPQAQRDSRELMSQIQVYLKEKSCILDLGCGPRDQAICIEYLGHDYVGVDYYNPAADILACAHALPFKSNSFDCILSYAVLEHLHNPFIAINEIERLLKGGGIFLGTVSQGEPFHDSYFHHTPWGIISLIDSAKKMRIRKLWDSMDTLASLARMGRYPRIIKGLIKAIDWIHIKNPYLSSRKIKWSEREKRLDKLFRAGSVCFVVQKEP